MLVPMPVRRRGGSDSHIEAGHKDVPEDSGHQSVEVGDDLLLETTTPGQFGDFDQDLAGLPLGGRGRGSTKTLRTNGPASPRLQMHAAPTPGVSLAFPPPTVGGGGLGAIAKTSVSQTKASATPRQPASRGGSPAGHNHPTSFKSTPRELSSLERTQELVRRQLAQLEVAQKAASTPGLTIV